MNIFIVLARSSIERRKAQTTVITLANHKGRRKYLSWRHHFLKCKTKEPAKILSSSGIRGGKYTSVHNFTAQVFRLETRAGTEGYGGALHKAYDRVF